MKWDEIMANSNYQCVIYSQHLDDVEAGLAAYVHHTGQYILITY